MIPNRRYIIARIPMPQGIDTKITDIQDTDDILKCVYESCVDSAPYTANYAAVFAKDNVNEDGTLNIDAICNDIWDFMQYEWPYDPDMAETEHRQEGRSVSVMIYTIWPRKFDCKHYATFAYSTLKALGIPCMFCLTSYENSIPRKPSHIYVVAFKTQADLDKAALPGGYEAIPACDKFVIDGTMPAYNEESSQGVTQYFRVKIS